MNNETLTTFGYPELLIRDYEYWAVVLRQEHVTVGSLVIITKTNALHLGELTEEHWAEFAHVTADCELLLKKTFGAEKFNYLALMMKDPNVHFHFIPRYSKPVTVNGKEFVDKDWPLKTALQPGGFTKTDLDEIMKLLRQFK